MHISVELRGRNYVVFNILCKGKIPVNGYIYIWLEKNLTVNV
mgnify:FL=1